MQISIEAYLDDSSAKVQQAILEAKNERINRALEETEEKTKEAYDNAIGAMRASYMMISGVAQVMGGSMGQIFSSLYAVAVSTIQVFSAIAAAQFFVPGRQMESVLMVAALISAISSLGAVMIGQTRLSKAVSGINMSLHGISTMINIIPNW